MSPETSTRAEPLDGLPETFRGWAAGVARIKPLFAPTIDGPRRADHRRDR
jgi:hypothetical protein